MRCRRRPRDRRALAAPFQGGSTGSNPVGGARTAEPDPGLLERDEYFATLDSAERKADIDEVAWASLHSTESRPFPRPETGKIAVKVINDYGDEVMKVFPV